MILEKLVKIILNGTAQCFGMLLIWAMYENFKSQTEQRFRSFLMFISLIIMALAIAVTAALQAVFFSAHNLLILSVFLQVSLLFATMVWVIYPHHLPINDISGLWHVVNGATFLLLGGCGIALVVIATILTWHSFA